MSRQDIVSSIAQEADVSKAEAQRILGVVGSALSEAIIEEGEATLPGIGKFKLARRAARTGRNPKTGDPIEVPEKGVVKFSPCKSLREAVA